MVIKNEYKNKIAFISYLDEKTRNIEMFVEIIRWDASFIEFKTRDGNNILIPTCRILKIKYKKEQDENKR